VLFSYILLCVGVSVMNVVYSEIGAVFLHPYKIYVLSLEVSVINVYKDIGAVSYIRTKHSYCV
jgi:hypothetical protein